MSPALSHRCKKQNDIIQNMAEGLLDIAVLPHFSKNVNNCARNEGSLNSSFEYNYSSGFNEIGKEIFDENSNNGDDNDGDNDTDGIDDSGESGESDKYDDHKSGINENCDAVEGNIINDNYKNRMRDNRKSFDAVNRNLDGNNDVDLRSNTDLDSGLFQKRFMSVSEKLKLNTRKINKNTKGNKNINSTPTPTSIPHPPKISYSPFSLGMWEPLAGPSIFCAGTQKQFQIKNNATDQDCTVKQNLINQNKSPDRQQINGIHHLNNAFTPRGFPPQNSSFPTSLEMEKEEDCQTEKGEKGRIHKLDGKISALDGRINIECDKSEKSVVDVRNDYGDILKKNSNDCNKCNTPMDELFSPEYLFNNNDAHTYAYTTTNGAHHVANAVKQMDKYNEKMINNRAKSGLIADQSFLLIGCSITKYTIKVIDKNCQRITSLMIIQR